MFLIAYKPSQMARQETMTDNYPHIQQGSQPCLFTLRRSYTLLQKLALIGFTHCHRHCLNCFCTCVQFHFFFVHSCICLLIILPRKLRVTCRLHHLRNYPLLIRQTHGPLYCHRGLCLYPCRNSRAPCDMSL